MKTRTSLFFVFMLASAASLLLPQAVVAGETAEDETVFQLRPKPNATKDFGHVGPTGILAHVYPGVKVKITGTREGSPAEGKFAAGEFIVGVNGQSLMGKNPYRVLGEAITAAEVSDGKMVFELETEKGPRRETVQIPVRGAYAPNWPVDCPKSERIVEEAAAFYVKHVMESEDMGIPIALPCLFLLSTGDDRYLPAVRAHIQKFIDKPNSIGNHTWNNGYNGILFAEYYLRTGEQDVLPLLQAICDDARDRQNFNAAWKHWGSDINPGYVAGGLMNPASTQVLTTLLLSKEAGVDVDEATLLNCLRYFYRFVGHGGIPYGDHRGEGGVSSNGKDGMIAAAMQIAMDASSDTSIYQSARDYQSMATLDSWPGMIMGHGDHGRGDGIWRGVASFYLFEKEHARYREVMDRLIWWYDLSRYDDGGLGLASCIRFNDPGSGAAAAMIYTAPRKALRILGAAPSEHAKAFELPEHLWGNQADLVFHSLKPAEGFDQYGAPMPMHRIVDMLGTAYSGGQIADDPEGVPLEQLQRLVRHPNYKVRTQAAIAMRVKGEIQALEALLKHPDPRVRRAALDGIIDWRYFFATGKNPLKAEQFTPGMIESISAMLTDPNEATYVVEGALFAIGFMPPEAIQENFEAILPWAKHEDWWFRHAAFMAVHGMVSDPELYLRVVPMLTEMMVRENHTMPRTVMNARLSDALKKHGTDSEIGRHIELGFEKAVAKTQILDGNRDREGKFNIAHAIGEAAQVAPENGPDLAALLVQRGLALLDDDELLWMVTGARGFEGFTKLSKRLEGPAKMQLEETLSEHMRPELTRRLKASGGKDLKLIDAILGVDALQDDSTGWQITGTPPRKDRVWRYLTFDPIAEKDILPKREGRRYRRVELPEGLESWFRPGYDDRKWQSGRAPIGKGSHPRARNPIEPRSVWGDGEFLLARTTFKLENTDFELYRLRILCQQGFDVYLNGEKIKTYTWWAGPDEIRKWEMSARDAELLREGLNTLAVYTMEFYPSSHKPHWKGDVFGILDCYIEGLNVKSLY